MVASPLRMRSRARRSLALLLAALVAAAPLASAQEPAAAQPPASGTAPSPVGGWNGWVKLTNEWPGLTCHYETAANVDGVHLELHAAAAGFDGSLAIDVPAAPGSGCPPLRKRYAVADVTENAGIVVFTDSGGNEWTLTLRRQGEVLQGLVAWRQGGPDQPLAEGFTMPSGQRPLARLSGEVRLRRSEEEPAPAAAAAGGAAAAGAKRKTGAGTFTKYGLMILSANVVGLGLLYGANQAGKGGVSGGSTCSPRYCHIGLANANCSCNTNQTTAQPCLAGAPNGVALGGTCDGKTLLCQQPLSCNVPLGNADTQGVCEDVTPPGRCPL